MLDCIKNLKRHPKRHAVDPSHPWKTEGRISPSRKLLGVADANACLHDHRLDVINIKSNGRNRFPGKRAKA